MAFLNATLHRITRNSPLAAISTQTRQDDLIIDGKTEEFLYEIKTQFTRKSGKMYGRFSDETIDHPVSSWLREYRQEKLSFTSFTQKALNHFSSTLDKNETFIDAYIIFVIEKIEAGDILYVFVTEHMSALYVNQDLALSDSFYIDTTGFSLAAKIDLTEWDEGDSATYVTLLKSRSDKDISDAFTNFIGFSDKHDIKTDTITFLGAVEEFSQTLDEPTARVTRNKIANYCIEQHKAGKPVVIEDLSKNLSEEIKSYSPEHFSQFVETKTNDIKHEFIADTNQIRNYIRISGRSDSLSMSFASECLGKEIVYDPSSDSLTITNIPPALKARLLKHLKAN